ncbi:hypothetical protein D0S45_05730 [Marinifilum sp. JC120]|nr:hypothetical protein D0S45_05730 [Marinifilum sp. JC120]
MFKWGKKGIVLAPDDIGDWAISHAQVPVPLLLEDRLRIFFACRCSKGLSRTTYADVKREDPTEVIYVHNEPILDLGRHGAFDEFGIMPSGVIATEGKIYLYYGAWSRLNSEAAFHNGCGLAISSDGGKTFRKFVGPIFSRTHDEELWSSSPFVYKVGDEWRCLYTHATDWVQVGDKFESTYHIKQVTSDDGIFWSRERPVAIEQRSKNEAITRACAIKMDDCYHSWFSYRSICDYRDGVGAYKIGYAKSRDGIEWKRDDCLAGLPLGEAGDFDDKMQAYPYVIFVDGRCYMFYNGNSFGEQGFACAELITE